MVKGSMGKNAKIKRARQEARANELKLDLGCGKSVADGFDGVDSLDFGQKYTLDLAELKRGVPEWMVLMPPTPERVKMFQPWPWEDSSVDAARASHVFEHLTSLQRVHFVNELHRVMKQGAKCELITPHWASGRAYGDPTHVWPAVSEFAFYYLAAEWRKANVPALDEILTCDFTTTWGYLLNPVLNGRNHDYQQNAVSWWKEAAQDTIATLVKN